MVQTPRKPRGRKVAAKPKTEVKPTPPQEPESNNEEKVDTRKVNARKPVTRSAKASQIREYVDESVKVEPELMEVGNEDNVCEDEEEMDDDLKKAPEMNGKRSQDNTETVPQKKQKTDLKEDIVTLSFTNLPEGISDEIFRQFLKNKDIELIASCANYNRCNAFVNVYISDEEKALSLDQEEWNGAQISVSIASPKNQDYSKSDARTLHVKNLPYDAHEDDVKEIFQDVDQVRILTDKLTGKSRGIAFVEFKSVASADKAMETKDDFTLDGRQLLISRAGEVTKLPANTKILFVSGITQDMTEEEVSKLFPDASEVRMVKTDTGINKSFAFVEFESEALAAKCCKSAKSGIETGHGSDKLIVRFATAQSKVLFVSGFTKDTTKKEVSTLFPDASEIRMVTKGTDKHFAFVEFESGDLASQYFKMAQDGIKTEDGTTNLVVMYAKDGDMGSKSSTSKTLFVRGVTEDMSKEELSKYFEGADQIRMITDNETRKNKPFAYVDFPSKDLATKCFTSAKDGIKTDDDSTIFYVSYATIPRGGKSHGFRGRGRRGGRFGANQGRGGRGRGSRGRPRGRGGSGR